MLVKEQSGKCLDPGHLRLLTAAAGCRSLLRGILPRIADSQARETVAQAAVLLGDAMKNRSYRYRPISEKGQSL